MDQTEGIRRQRVSEINSTPSERDLLKMQHGQVWDTKELTQDFEVVGFMAPFVMVRRIEDDVKGSMKFQDNPRYCFDFQPV